jgi:hypothetical protein
MEVPRDEEFEVQETGVDQFLCNVLDCNVRLCDDPNCVRGVLCDLTLNYGGDHGGLSGTGRTLVLFVSKDKKMERLNLQ